MSLSPSLFKNHGNKSRLHELEIKVNSSNHNPIFINSSNYNDIVKELWLNPNYLIPDTEQENYKYYFKIYNNKLYFRVSKNNESTFIFNCAINLPTINNYYNTPIELKVSTTNNTSLVNVGDIVGYIVLNDVINTSDTSTGSLLNNTYISKLGNFPIINNLVNINTNLVEKYDNITISLPKKIYAVVGDTLQLFYRGIVGAINPYNYEILVSCQKGKQTPRYFEYTPTTSDVGTTNFTITVKNNTGEIITTNTCLLQTVQSPKSPSTNTKVLCFGASNTAGGQWVKEASRRLKASDGTPKGNSLTNIDFCGSIKDSTAGWFGVGGWSWSTYTAAGNPAFRFFVSGVTSLTIGSVYTNNGYSYTIKEVNITSGSGNILCETSSKSNTPLSSGTLTKSSGNGDSKITFNKFEVDAQNPLWDVNGNKMTFVPYANEVAEGQIDVVYTFLTWNGITPNMTTDDFSNILSKIKIFADTLHSEFPNAKLKLLGQNLPSLNGGMGANYGATGTGYSDQFGMLRTILNMNKVYQDFASKTEYSSFVEFVNVSSQFDVEYNMQSTETNVNTRNSKKERLDTNGVHPSIEGYYQIADVVYRNFVANFCQ